MNEINMSLSDKVFALYDNPFAKKEVIATNKSLLSFNCMHNWSVQLTFMGIRMSVREDNLSLNEHGRESEGKTPIVSVSYTPPSAQDET